MSDTGGDAAGAASRPGSPQAGPRLESDPVDVAVGFACALRRSGLEVSLTSALLYAEALSVCDVGSRPSLYWAGRAALVHRIEDVDVYDAVFGAYWLGEPLGMPRMAAASVPVILAGRRRRWIR